MDNGYELVARMTVGKDGNELNGDNADGATYSAVGRGGSTWTILA